MAGDIDTIDILFKPQQAGDELLSCMRIRWYWEKELLGTRDIWYRRNADCSGDIRLTDTGSQCLKWTISTEVCILTGMVDVGDTGSMPTGVWLPQRVLVQADRQASIEGYIASDRSWSPFWYEYEGAGVCKTVVMRGDSWRTDEATLNRARRALLL